MKKWCMVIIRLTNIGAKVKGGQQMVFTSEERRTVTEPRKGWSLYAIAPLLSPFPLPTEPATLKHSGSIPKWQELFQHSFPKLKKELKYKQEWHCKDCSKQFQVNTSLKPGSWPVAAFQTNYKGVGGRGEMLRSKPHAWEAYVLP